MNNKSKNMIESTYDTSNNKTTEYLMQLDFIEDNMHKEVVKTETTFLDISKKYYSDCYRINSIINIKTMDIISGYFSKLFVIITRLIK